MRCLRMLAMLSMLFSSSPALPDAMANEDASAAIRAANPASNADVRAARAPSSPAAISPLDASWWGGFALPVRNGLIFALTSFGGQTVVGGPFTQAGTTHARYVAAWTGAGWQAFGEGPPWSVEALVVHGGQLIAAGPPPPGVGERPTVHAWDGSQWNTLASSNAAVHALAVHDGELYAGGDFTSINGVAAARIARWDGDQWQPLGPGITSAGVPSVRALQSFGTTLIAAGDFSNLQSVAAWDGASWSVLGDGLQTTSGTAKVNGLTTIGANLYACGFISRSGATVLGNLARWDGVAWSAVNFITAQPQAVNQWNAMPVTGLNLPNPRPARWDGVSWLTDGSPNMTPHAFVHDGTNLYCGGFSHSAAAGDGFLSFDGNVWTTLMQPWAPGMSGLNNRVQDLLTFGGELYAAGPIRLAGAEDHWVTTSEIAKWNGSAWSAIPFSLPSTVYALGTFSGSLVAAVNSATYTVRRLDPGGWTTLGPGASGFINRTAEHGSDLIAVGTFTSFGATPVNGIARWNGSTWSPVGTGFDVANVDYPWTAISYGGEIVVGGQLSSAGGSTVHNLVRWDGAAFQDLGGGTNGEVLTLALSGGDLLVGGGFTQVGGITAHGAARWNGTAWSSLGDNAEYVYQFREHAGRLFAVGEFEDALGEDVYGVAVWTGERWYPLGTGVDGSVTSLAFLGDDLYIGGQFGWASGKPSFNIARLPAVSTVGVDDRPLAVGLALAASPNPSRGPVRFAVSLPRAGRVRLTVHDVSGRLVAVVADEVRDAGAFSVTWSEGVPAGLYFASLKQAGKKRTVRLARLN